jgi:hypothetical protein
VPPFYQRARICHIYVCHVHVNSWMGGVVVSLVVTAIYCQPPLMVTQQLPPPSPGQVFCHCRNGATGQFYHLAGDAAGQFYHK